MVAYMQIMIDALVVRITYVVTFKTMNNSINPSVQVMIVPFVLAGMSWFVTFLIFAIIRAKMEHNHHKLT